MKRSCLHVTAAAVLVLFAVPASGGPASAASLGVQLPRYQSTLTLADIDRLSQDASKRSIIIFRDQHPDLATAADARNAAEDADQKPVRDELAQVHARNVHSFHVVSAVAATISDAEIDRLTTNPAVQAVVPDLAIPAPTASDPTVPSQSTAALDPQQICPSDPSVPLLEPEALQLMNVEFQPGSGQPGAHDIVDGTGVKVAWIADGIDINNPDFRRNGQSIFVDYQDFSGEGLNAPTGGVEAFGDASAIAAQGSQTYDLSTFVNPAHPLPPGCNIKVKGVAPGVSLVGLKVFGDHTIPFASLFLQAIERAVTVDKVDVINESFGANVYPDPANDPIALADTAAVKSGVTVVVSSGDAGTNSTIETPSDASGVIGVGATTSFRLYRQTTSFASQLDPGGWVSNNISGLSSGGFTQFGPHTVDVVAPGDLGWAVCTANLALYTGCLNNAGRASNIQAFGGTSQSSPLTAGTAALIIQAFEQTHGGTKPDADLVKQIIVSSATDLHVPAEEQGAGLVNALKAVQLAESIDGPGHSTAPIGSGLLVSQTRLSDTRAAGTTASFSVHVTNTGADPQTVTPTVQVLDPTLLSNDTGTLTENPTTDPKFIDGNGVRSSFVLHQFAVPSGADRLDASVTWNGAAQPNARVRETLFDPTGKLAAYTLPQGPGGFNHVDVHDPAPGTWTAVFWVRDNATVYSGAFKFLFTTQRFQTIGTVSPASHTLAPGDTGSFSVKVPMPTQAGDLGAGLALSTGHSDDGSIPITLRSLVPIGDDGGAFQGTLSGGNGRPIFGAQTLTFQFDVPRGRPSLDMALQLQDPNYNVTGFLVDPSGEPLDIQSTSPITGGSAVVFTSAMQFFEQSPKAGRWTGVLALNAPVTGDRLQEPFSGAISFAPAPVVANGLPSSPATRLPSGQPVNVSVTVTNSGLSQKAFFADPRLNATGDLELLGLNPTQVALPQKFGDASPAFLAPTNSSRLTIATQGTVPVQMDIFANFGSPDIEAVSQGNNAVAQHDASEVSPGVWFGGITEVGPFGATGAVPATADVAASIRAKLFDSAVTSDTGDLWLAAVDNTAAFSPLVLDPGQSGTINVTITPNAPTHSVVRGFLAIDTFNPNTLSGDELVNIPYTYRVG